MSSATDTIRAMLDERGIEWTANDGEHVKETCWPYMGELTATFAEYDNGTTRFACDTWCFTPAQAIAATLGTGTLTAEQVSNATYTHSIHADCADADWQAIADELNAMLGRGTCRLVETEHEQEIFDGGYYTYWSYDCDECGHENTEYERFCAGCGRKVVDE